MKRSNFCPKCGKPLLLCFCIALVGGAPAVEPIIPPPECGLSADYIPRRSAQTCALPVGDVWAPHGEEHDHGQPATAPVAETGGAAPSAGPLPPWGWEATSNLPAAYRSRRRSSAAINQPDDSAWMGQSRARPC
jgi:hypothetical protein